MSTGPVQAGTGTGIWLSWSPPESPPSWTGLGSLSSYLFPAADVALLSWPLALIVFLIVGFVHLSKTQQPRWWRAAWTCAVMAGAALAVLAVVSYQLPAPVNSAAGRYGSSLISYSTVGFVNWHEIPATVGFLILAVPMWRIVTSPARSAARPGKWLWLALLFAAADVLVLCRHVSWEGGAQAFVAGAAAVTGVVVLILFLLPDRGESMAIRRPYGQ
ncbi:MAG: hypothetical protein ACRDPO_33170 [Streptosporangiaceae bacterium]